MDNSMIQEEMKIDIIQYDCNFILSIRNKVTNRLPLNIYNKIISYQNPRYRRRQNTGFNKFMMARNPDSINIDELELEVKKEMTGLLNKVTNTNLDKMRDKISHIISLINDVENQENKIKVQKIIMQSVLKKAIIEKSYSKLYATILSDMSDHIELDYCEYLDNLFVEIRKSNMNGKLSKDYDQFCNQLKNRDNFISLFIFIGELYKIELLDSVLVKKYLMILFKNITTASLDNSLVMETNAHCIKNLLFRCEKEDFYDVVYSDFKKMQNDNKYKHKFRFILMDINEKYEELYN